jgi:hypothetical protein
MNSVKEKVSKIMTGTMYNISNFIVRKHKQTNQIESKILKISFI